MENTTDVFLGLHDFLERMRQPSASDFVKSIKSFIVSFSNNAPDPERGSALVQEFLGNMEIAFRAHPLWAGCSEEELESAGEGLEKYVMTKLFTRVFASLPDDVKVDEQLSEKMSLIQQFVRPENLDIKPTFQNETSWLLAQKELQKINMYKAPRDKLICVLNCCKVINNLLLNASIASNENPPGADEFLPVLIYVTIKANPPQLHSNLLYIQRYRRQSRLVAESAYFLTNMLSTESFISNIDAKSLSMEETEFANNMEFAQALLSGLSSEVDGHANQIDQNMGKVSKADLTEHKNQSLKSKERDFSVRTSSSETMSESKDVKYAKDESFMAKILSLSDIENRGATIIMKEDPSNQVFQEYPYLFAQVGDLTMKDVEDLLNNYKKLAFKYVCLSKGLDGASSSIRLSNSQTSVHLDAKISTEHCDTGAIEPKDESQKRSGVPNVSSTLSFVSEENVESKPLEEETLEPQGVRRDETSER